MQASRAVEGPLCGYGWQTLAGRRSGIRGMYNLTYPYNPRILALITLITLVIPAPLIQVLERASSIRMVRSTVLRLISHWPSTLPLSLSDVGGPKTVLELLKLVGAEYLCTSLPLSLSI